MKYALIQAYMNNTIWLCKSELAVEMFNIVGRMIHSGKPLSFDGVTYGQEEVNQEKVSQKGIGIVELHGPVFNRGNLMVDLSGSVSPQSFSKNMIDMADNDDIAEIIMSVDSGGGEVTNIDEAASAVRYATTKKPVTTVANGLMCSAAYWIGSQANKVLSTKGSQVGSIGAVIAHSDFTKANEQEGIDVKIYRTGDEKALGQKVDSNDATMEASMNALLTDALDLFAEDVATARGFEKQYVLDKFALNKEGSLRGNTVFGVEALELGLIDGITTFQGAVSESVTRVAQAHSRKKTFLQTRKLPSAKKVGNMEEVLASILASVGLNEGATDEEVLAALAKQTSTKVSTERTKILAKLSLDSETTDEQLDLYIAELKARAADGKQYRADMLEKLAALTISTEGNDESGQATAERMKKIFSSADIGDIRAEVERLEVKKDSLVPDGRKSKNSPDEPAKKVKPDLDSV